MANVSRDLRVGDFVRDEVADIVRSKLRDPRVGMVSINDVRVSKDLSYADVYVSSVDATTDEEREALIGVLNHGAGFIRSELAKRHSMRTTPKPRFHYDDLVERGPALEALIDRAVADDESKRSGDDG